MENDVRKIFVTGIGTNVGKTVFSAVLAEALQADYWKPVQAGTHAQTDSMYVQSMLSNKKSQVWTEAFVLKEPMSPHAAAAREGIQLKAADMVLPRTTNQHLIIEGAGGVMVPLHNDFLIRDLISLFDAEVVLVSSNYLGSINHTLLSIEALKPFKLKGIVFSGIPNEESESFILNYSRVPLLGRIPQAQSITPAWVKEQAEKFRFL